MVKNGDVLHTSWGYDMTMNDFCKVLEVSKTGKTVKCRMLVTETNGMEYGPGGAGKAAAGYELVGPEFRRHDSDSKRRGSFSKSDPGATYYENHWD